MKLGSGEGRKNVTYENNTYCSLKIKPELVIGWCIPCNLMFRMWIKSMYITFRKYIKYNKGPG
jgi:hypothetical protein